MPKVPALITICALLPAVIVAQSEKKSVHRVDQIARMKRAVVQIRYTSDAATPAPGGPGQVHIPQRIGTGFFVSQGGYVLTAAHVLRLPEREARAAGATSVLFQVAVLLDPLSRTNGPTFRGSFSFINANPVDVDEQHDVALLKVTRNPFDPFFGNSTRIYSRSEGMLPYPVSVASLNSALPPEGTDVLISGYP